MRVVGKGIPVTPDAATERSLRATATKSMPLSEVTRRYGQLDVATALFDKLRATMPNEFVAAGLSEGVPGKYWLSIVGTPSPSLLKLLEEQPFNVTVNTGLPANERQLTAAVEDLATTVEADPAVSVADVSYDPIGTGINVDYTLASDARTSASSVSDRLVDTITTDLPQVVDDVPVAIAAGSQPGFTPAADVEGGHSVGGCTSGFTANYSGNPGVITAGHCSEPSYEGDSSVLQAMVTLWSGGNIDVRFSRTHNEWGHTTSKMFQDWNGHHTVVTGVGTPLINGPVCKFGLVTGRHCGDLLVTEVNTCRYNDEGRLACRLAIANRSVVLKGDSGGPWYWGAGARGTTVGFTSSESLFVYATALADYGITIRQN